MKYEDKELIRWNNLTPVEQMREVVHWAEYEDCDVLDQAKSVNDLIEMYKFITMTIGVEFLSGVYECIDEEEMDGDTETQEKVDEFNKRIGYKLI